MKIISVTLKRLTKLRLFFVILFLIFLCGMYINSTTFFRLKLADHYVKIQNYDKAITIYKKILRKEVINFKFKSLSSTHILTYYTGYTGLANLLIVGDRIVELPQVFKQMLGVIPAPEIELPALNNSEDPLKHYQVALIYLRHALYEKAIKEFRAVIYLYNKAPGQSKHDLENYLTDAYYNLALDFEEKGKPNEAIPYYRKVIDANDVRIVDAYYRLISLYKKQNKIEDAKVIESLLLNLKPEYDVNHKFHENLILLGFSFNKKEFELFNEGEITFFWQVGNQNSELIYMRDASNRNNIYKIGYRLYEVKKVKNLAPNFGFEMDKAGKSFPEGWDEDYVYHSPASAHAVVSEISDSEKTKCLLLDNTVVENTGCQSKPFVVKEDSYYVQSGRIKTAYGRAYFGRQWFNSQEGSMSYDYLVTAFTSPRWKDVTQVVAPPPLSEYCRLWLLNCKNYGKVYFDDIIFFEIQVLSFSVKDES